MKPIAISIFGLCLLFALPVRSEIPDHVIRDTTEATFEGRRTSLIFAVETGNDWTLTAIFSQPFGLVIQLDPYASRRWLAKRQYGRDGHLSDRTEWADSTTCPELEGMLWSLSKVPVPAVQVPGFVWPRPHRGTPSVGIPTHGSVFTVWNSAELQSGAPSWLRLSSLGGELADWGRASETNLTECWHPTAPTA